MKLPIRLSDIFSKRNEKVEYYLSLIVDSIHVAGACWKLSPKKQPDLTHAVARRIQSDSWDERIEAADQVITALEERTGTEDIHKVIFGLPLLYLTETGDIDQKVRQHLKQLTSRLELTPIGYVSLPQAIVYKLKQDEGVPPTAILIGLSGNVVTITVYKIGNLIGSKAVPLDADVMKHIESVLKETIRVEVLPSRILLYGGQLQQLDSFKTDLMRFPWPTRVNFLHFPKITILPQDFSVTSVSMAGASELTSSMPPEEEAETSEKASETAHLPVQPDVVVPEISPKIKPTDHNPFPDSDETVKPDLQHNTEIDNEDSKVQNVTDEDKDTVADQTGSDDDADSDNEAGNGSAPAELDVKQSNVSFVTPESLGFHRNEDVLVSTEAKKSRQKQEDADNSQAGSGKDTQPKAKNRRETPGTMFMVSRILHSTITRVKSFNIPRIKSANFILLPAVGIVLMVILGWLFTWYLPKATIAVKSQTKSVEGSLELTIDSSVSVTDPAKGIISGHKVEKTVSGEKTVPATGKKKVGDPARGTVIIYNKTLQTRVFKKGSTVSSGSVQFTLDTDVQVASASESIGSITFGKVSAELTAKNIGTQGNLPSSSEFVFSEVAPAVASARNDQPFSGGTSRDVTVVSRADYDTIVSALNRDLLDTAKSELSSSMTGSLRLIEDTIKSSVSKKEFTQEIDQESKEVHGVVDVTVSGIAYDVTDVNTLMLTILQEKVPEGYKLAADKNQIDFGKLTLNKDGTITADISVMATAIPMIDITDIRTKYAGKNVRETKSTISQIPGVTDVDITVHSLIFKDNLPRRTENITVQVEDN